MNTLKSLTIALTVLATPVAAEMTVDQQAFADMPEVGQLKILSAIEELQEIATVDLRILHDQDTGLEACLAQAGTLESADRCLDAAHTFAAMSERIAEDLTDLAILADAAMVELQPPFKLITPETLERVASKMVERAEAHALLLKLADL